MSVTVYFTEGCAVIYKTKSPCRFNKDDIVEIPGKGRYVVTGCKLRWIKETEHSDEKLVQFAYVESVEDRTSRLRKSFLSISPG